MLDGIVKDIQELALKNHTVKVGENTYAASNLVMVRPPIDRPKALVAQSLSGLIDYLRDNRDELEISQLIIQVQDYSKVTLFNTIEEPDQQRTFYFNSELDKNLPQFPFEQYMSAEDFIIKANAMFEPTDDLAEIIKYLSLMTNQNSIKTQDDGVSQTLEVKRAVNSGLKEEVLTKGRYLLAPYRTFREILQPRSTFIFRVKAGDENTLPKATLFDAEGGGWRYKALLDIRDFIKDQLAGLSISIPVIA